MDEDGWLRDTDGGLIVWIPPGLRENIQVQGRLVLDNMLDSNITLFNFGGFSGLNWEEMVAGA